MLNVFNIYDKYLTLWNEYKREKKLRRKYLNEIEKRIKLTPNLNHKFLELITDKDVQNHLDSLEELKKFISNISYKDFYTIYSNRDLPPKYRLSISGYHKLHDSLQKIYDNEAYKAIVRDIFIDDLLTD